MVQLLRREPVKEYELQDAAGRTIGYVIRPASLLRTGPGAETVLLIRDPLKRSSPRPGSAGTNFPLPSYSGGRSCAVPGFSRP
jgi:hypothetical protein